jgi:hypothetical protein
MASYIAALLRIRDELSTSAGPELRAELEAALAAFTKELQAAQRKRQAA